VVNRVVTEVKETVTEAINLAQTEIRELPGQVESIAKSTYNTLSNVGSTLWQDTKTAVNDLNTGLNQAGSAISNALQATASFVNKYQGCLLVAAWVAISVASGGLAAYGLESVAGIGAADAAIAATGTGIGVGTGTTGVATVLAASSATAYTTFELFDVVHDASECARELSS
jgi:phage-related protein